MTVPTVPPSSPPSGTSRGSLPEHTSAFCIDFNWDRLGRFASPGLYAGADARRHVDWYEQLGVSTIQSFFVSHNGFAWYDSDVAPRIPGMNGSFLGDLTELAHDRGLNVMGYFSPGANDWWRYTHKDLSHPASSAERPWTIPFTQVFLDYLRTELTDSLTKVPVQGFMIDFLWNVEPRWIACEQQMWTELMEEPFPASIPDADATAEYGRRAVDRAWEVIRSTAREVNPELLIWLSCNDLSATQAKDTRVAKEVDWLMNEHPDSAALAIASAVKGPETQIVQCVCGWGDGNAGQVAHDAANLLDSTDEVASIVYGFARPDEVTTLPKAGEGTVNARNIEAMRAHLQRS